jgi:ABC-type nitrate/sulfonate/bicarbonate transport system permease component
MVTHSFVAGDRRMNAHTETLSAQASVAESQVDSADLEALGAPSRVNRKLWAIRIISMIVVIGGWEVFGRQVNPLFMSYPSAIFTAGIDLARSGELIQALSSSLRTLFTGFIVASIIGIVLGLLIGRYRTVDAATDWLVNALYSTPLVAIIPLATLWLGLGEAAKLFIVIILTVFPVLINTSTGVRNVPSQLIDVGSAFAANEHEIFRKIILPAALPYMMTGLRLGIGRAIIGMVVAEFFTAISGLGALIVKYGNQYDTASMFVPILLLMVLGILLTSAVRYAESTIAPWRHTEE